MLTGMRNTKTKQYITDLLHRSPTPLGLSTVFKSVKKKYPDTAFSTVYRIVTNLVKLEKVTKVDLRDRGSTYEWADRAHHHHLICNSCGDIEDVSDELLKFDIERVTQSTRFRVDDHAIELYGRCEPCQNK